MFDTVVFAWNGMTFRYTNSLCGGWCISVWAEKGEKVPMCINHVAAYSDWFAILWDKDYKFGLGRAKALLKKTFKAD